MTSPDTPTAAEDMGVGTGDLLAVEATQALERIRASKIITRRGTMICGQVMAEMLRIGWKKEQLDLLEIIFWSVRDGNGEVIKHSSANTEAREPGTR